MSNSKTHILSEHLPSKTSFSKIQAPLPIIILQFCILFPCHREAKLYKKKKNDSNDISFLSAQMLPGNVWSLPEKPTAQLLLKSGSFINSARANSSTRYTTPVSNENVVMINANQRLPSLLSSFMPFHSMDAMLKYKCQSSAWWRGDSSKRCQSCSW